MSPDLLLRVTSIRSQNPTGLGGCIFSAAPITETGEVLDARRHYVVRAKGNLLGATAVQVGQWWRVTGNQHSNEITVNGYRVTEEQIEADSLLLALPSGEHIITLMAECEAFRGIGRVKARRLWETFQDQLYDVLDAGDINGLATVLSQESARQVVEAWRTYGDARTLHWLQTYGFSASIGRKLLAFFGPETAEGIEQDPYRLLSFCSGWAETDKIAQEYFHIAENDPRRLQGAIEEALYRLFGDGHTVATVPMLTVRLASVLGSQATGLRWRPLVAEALAAGLSNGSYLVSADHTVHSLGPYVMEAAVAKALANRLTYTAPPLLDSYQIEGILHDFEGEEGYSLNDEQRAAVIDAVMHPLMLITGGAGVGKTTVLKALYKTYDAAGIRILQVALAGRAAKRLQEATDRPANTLASFIQKTSDNDLNGPTVVVVDEASMVDIITMYRLCELIPEHVRLVLVGDPAQLMPVGPGLVLHTLVAERAIPRIELTTVKRHGGQIAAAALSIREGIWPALTDDERAPIAFIPTKTGAFMRDGEQVCPLADTVLRLYREAPDDTQILSARRAGPDGIHYLNSICQLDLAEDAQPLLIWNDEFDQAVDTGFRLGDPVICTRNLWERGIQNGSLGRIIEIEAIPQNLTNDVGAPIGQALAWVEWDDGERRPILEEMLDDLALGYAITVHKSQGSQWPRVIVALSGSRLLDRTLIYTAVTRAQAQVLLVGDIAAARRAVEALPKAHHRHVGLGALLRNALSISRVT